MTTHKTTLYISRHGQTQWNLERRMQGHLDSPLTALGQQQAGWLRDALHDVDFTAIYASSSPRARHTAEIVRGPRQLEVQCYDELREIGTGTWEGKTREEIMQFDPSGLSAYWETPHLYQPTNGGETVHDLQRRTVPFIETLLDKHAGETILVVTHSGTLKAIMAHFEPRPLAAIWLPPIMRETALNKIIIEDGHAHIAMYGDISHYQDMLIKE